MYTRRTFAALLAVISVLFFSCSPVKLDAVSKKYIKEGIAKYKNHDYESALNISRTAAAYDPKNLYAFQLMGSSYYMMDHYDAAIKEYDTAITINPKDNFSRFYRSNALARLKKYDSAIADNDFNIKHNYMKACSYNNRAANEGKLKKYDAALKDCDSCLSTAYYNHRFAYYNKFDIYLKLEKYDLALAELDKYTKADPKQLSYAVHVKNLNEAQLLKIKDDLPKDTSFINQMQCFKDAYTEKGYLYIQMGRYNKALWNLNHERLIPIPNYTQLVYKSYIPKFTRQFDTAFVYVDSAIRLKPNDGFAYMCKGNIYNAMGNYDEAKRYYYQALSKDSSLGYGYEYRGYLYCREGKIDSAIADFKNATTLNENTPKSYLQNAIGYAYFLNKQYKEAIANYDSAKLLGNLWYQPYYEFKQEAIAAMENKESNFCTLIHWQAPINDANGLVDVGRFYIKYGEPLVMNFKIVTNKPIVMNKLFLMLEGQSVAETNPNAVKLIKEDKANGIFEYEYATKLTLQKGGQELKLEYDGKSSQRMVVVVE